MAEYLYRKEIRLSKREYDTLQTKATRSGVSTSTFIRKLIMKSELKERPINHIDVQKLYNEMNHIGVNINQIARVANSGGLKNEHIDTVMFLLARLNETFTKLTEG